MDNFWIGFEKCAANFMKVISPGAFVAKQSELLAKREAARLARAATAPAKTPQWKKSLKPTPTNGLSAYSKEQAKQFNPARSYRAENIGNEVN